MLATLRTGLQLGLLLTHPVAAQTPPAPWWPTTGAVILAGGNLDDAAANALVDRLIALAGGPDALIVVIPSAADRLPSRLPGPGTEPANVAATRRILESRGAHHVVFLHTNSRTVANSEEFVRILRTAKAVFFTGGRTKVLDQTYHATLVERELKALLDRGGVLAGDSAGAITLGCFWLGWPTATSSLGKITDGLCVLPRLTVTPHVRATGARIGENEMTDSVHTWVMKHPGTVAINIAEHTVLVLNGGTAEVLGSGAVSIFGALADPQAAIHLKAGAVLPLRTP